METKITEVTIIPIKPKKGLVALASCVIDEKFYVGSIGVYTRLKGGYRLTFPTKKVGDNSINLCHPINQDVGDAIEKAIADEYEKLVSQSVVIEEQNEQEAELA